MLCQGPYKYSENAEQEFRKACLIFYFLPVGFPEPLSPNPPSPGIARN
jgi:hypothetical protein